MILGPTRSGPALWGLPPYHPALDFLVGWIMGTLWKLAGTRRVCAAVLGACLAVGLAGCGGGSSAPADGGTPTTPPIPPERSGRLESARLLGSIPASEIVAALAAKESLAQDVVPRYGVTSYRLDYLTADADGREVRASGLVSVPIKAAGAKARC